ncbi:MAG: LptF/LptG family permease [Tannerella sp.]|jgi:lipopolysaccharide export system permease protein|nr:LptF/LptG family permease [Tannerella sp.]
MRIKRLYIFLLKTYLPMFVMAFGICLFIVLMQFLWKYVDEMVGKGLGVDVLGEFFFYAALSFVPMSLPLAILFASVMVFGNLGEHFELQAMKASGISLPCTMKPLVVFLCFVSAGSFYFQNNIIPASQVKMYTLLYSMKQKSPELEIPEGSFFSGIEGYSIHVRKKESSGLLRNVMIYDYSQGFNNAQVTVADSGRLKMSTDKLHLILQLYHGESFENQRQQGRTANNPEAVLYRKETFSYKELLIAFDANFNRASESLMEGRYIGKDLNNLQASIDSVTARLDSIKREYARQIYASSYRKSLRGNTANTAPNRRKNQDLVRVEDIDFDRMYEARQAGSSLSILNQAKSALERVSSEYSYNSIVLVSEEKELRRHHVEMHKKFTLSLACLVFFFIGAPLGAIIRKGGLGMAVIISVSLFIFYYIIDRIGTTMATNGMWLPWQGMWLSSAVLLLLGMFLTYKAAHDSVLLNGDVYVDKLKKFFGQPVARKIEKKEIIMYSLDYASFARRLEALIQTCDAFLKQNRRWIPYFTFWKNAGEDDAAKQIAGEVEAIVEEGNNSKQNLVLNKLMDYPFVGHYRLWRGLSDYRKQSIVAGWFFPLGLFVYLSACFGRKYLFRDIRAVRQVSEELLDIIRRT